MTPWIIDHDNFFLTFFLLRTNICLKPTTNKQSKEATPEAPRPRGQWTTVQSAQTYYSLLKTKPNKNRHRIKIYILVSVELSGFTILLLVIPKFLDSIGKFLKGAHSRQQKLPSMPLMLTAATPAVQLDTSCDRLACALSLDLIKK